MQDPVIYQTIADVALIQLNNPPVNGLGQAVRAGLQAAFRRAHEDAVIKAIIITSSTGTFCGGADISEFAAGNFAAEPALPPLLDEIEASRKPVIAAIDGVALGGGLELALACDYRLATPKALLGLPEVSLGILPGAGGTQRLPRFAGPQTALDMIVSGKPVPATVAQQSGFVDRIHSGDAPLADAAVEYAQELLSVAAPLRNCAEMSVDTSALPENFFTEYREKTAAKTHGFVAPGCCIDAVEAACNLPLDEGQQRERDLFAHCISTPQARAQQHLFFAERAAGKIPGVDPKQPAREVHKVAVIGAGTMGGGIAMNFINAGIETTILDLSADSLEKGLQVIRNNYDISAKKGRLTEAQVKERMGLLNTSTEYADIADADLVIEAVFERMDIKQTVFRTLDEVCKPGAILATNTSTLNVDEIAAATSRPGDVIGLHFFSPANVMRLLEIVRGKETAPDVIVTAQKLAKRIKKVPIVVGVCFGFVGNRMLEPYGREAMRLLLEGANPAQIDRVLTQFGLAMGLCSMSDLAGIDVSYLTRQGNKAATAHDPSYGVIGDRLYEKGHYGQKTGRGFYIYEGRAQSENTDVVEIAAAAAAELGISQRQISDQEILERCIYPLINEGAQILDEGIAYRASDCDLVYVNGYGFPAWRGGPMQYANEIGLGTVLAGLQKYRAQLGEYGEMWLKPAPLLERLVAEGADFKAFDARVTS